jgi:hypothetical protein
MERTFVTTATFSIAKVMQSPVPDFRVHIAEGEMANVRSVSRPFSEWVGLATRTDLILFSGLERSF